MSKIKIRSALVSVFHKDRLDPLLNLLRSFGVTLYSTGGTQQFIESLGLPVTAVEDLTGYPSILGGRVKTLHPKVFGGILNRQDHPTDLEEISNYEIPPIDLVIVDLYPFEETVASGASEQDIIEKIDIGGISLIRAAAKNFKQVVVVSSKDQYSDLIALLEKDQGTTQLEDRKRFAAQAFDISSHYDTHIFNYFNQQTQLSGLKISQRESKVLRYGENPHQEGIYYGNLQDMFDQIHGKELSYNNLVDIEAAVALIAEFDQTAFAILKHTNACGVATADSVEEAYAGAFAADTISAFGGILITNSTMTEAAAQAMDSLFFEVLIAPGYQPEALAILKGKKKRILLIQKDQIREKVQIKSLLNGFIAQDRDQSTDKAADFNAVTKRKPSQEEEEALVFASKIAKHTKSNTIVLAKTGQLLASGVGQTSRVDALKQAIVKAKHFGFDLNQSVMASDAFFPFPDCVEIAQQEGVSAVVQPGGSIRDQASIDCCDQHAMAMVFTGVRHFKH
ncbi:MAG: bifunctional phosphoribosylaminoimidazolecarboxamide formyltransferase/IMP cyclohydrolase [Cyclobacteriaceae bacterium]